MKKFNIYLVSESSNTWLGSNFDEEKAWHFAALKCFSEIEMLPALIPDSIPSHLEEEFEQMYRKLTEMILNHEYKASVELWNSFASVKLGNKFSYNVVSDSLH